MSHKELSEIFLKLLHGHLRSAVGSLNMVRIYLNRHIFAHVHSVSEGMVDRVQLFEHHEQISEENNHFVSRIVKNCHYQLDILLHVLDEGVKGLVTDFVNRVKK